MKSVMPFRLLPRGQLFRKYVVYYALLVCATLIASGGIGVYFYYQENKTALARLQQEKAAAAAYRIEQYVKEIEHQIGWTVLPVGAMPPEQRRFDYLRLLRQVPAITDVSLLDHAGQERLRVSRLAMDVADSRKDFSNDPRFIEARSGRTFFSPVYFRKETEPYMMISMPASRESAGVTVVEVNLKFIWDVVSQIKIGAAGYAYVVDARGRLVAHPDISLVLQKTDLSGLRQVQAAAMPAGTERSEVAIAHDRTGREVLTAAAAIPALNWFVFVEQPLEQAFAPLYALIVRVGLLLLFGLVLSVVASFVLARRMVTPIQALQTGAAQIGAGALDHRLEIHTGDELESLADQFNHMAAQLQESYANLEQKVSDRTRELAAVSQAKTRFLAAASHDLRQPMHALGMFISQLHDQLPRGEADRGPCGVVGSGHGNLARCIAGHFQARCRHPHAQVREFSGGGAVFTHGKQLRAKRAGERAQVPRRALQRLGAQRSSAAGAHPDEPCIQRDALYRAGRNRDWLPVPRGAPSHRSVGQRYRHPQGQAGRDIPGILSARQS